MSSSIDVVYSENVKPRENHMLHNLPFLQNTVNNLNDKKRKTSFLRIKMKQQNIFGLALIDTGKLVYSTIVSREFWEVKGGKLSESMDFKVGTADGQSDGLQVLGIGEPWPINLEGMEKCFILELLVIQGLSHSVNLGISFLMEHNLKIN